MGFFCPDFRSFICDRLQHVISTIDRMMQFFTYAIESETHKYIYVGLTNDFERRLFEHNSGYNATTKPYLPFRKIYLESFATRGEARVRERWLKSGIGKEYLKALMW